MIVVDESEPVGEIEPPFESRDVQIRRGLNVRDFFEMEEEIGRGKFGTVFKCREKKTGLRLAAKFVQAAKKADRINVEREVEIMKSLRNPRLIQLYDAFDDGKKEICLLLELIEGGELFERVIDDDFVLTERACAIFMRQICEGIQFIHLQHVLHLDMKPENILCLTRAGNRIKLIDFGLARRYDPSKKLQVLFGTPEFVAPEVVNFELIGYGTDMWSVGIIGYVLLSGLSPFMGETDVETMANVTIAKYDFDDEAFNDVSAEAKDFISKLLVKQISKRMTSTEALRHPWLRPRPPLPAPPPPVQHVEQSSSASSTSASPTPTSTPPSEQVPITSNSSPISETKSVNDLRMAPAITDKEPVTSLIPTPKDQTTVPNMQGQQVSSTTTTKLVSTSEVRDCELIKSSISSASNLIVPSPPNDDIRNGQSVTRAAIIESRTSAMLPNASNAETAKPSHHVLTNQTLSSAQSTDNVPTSSAIAAEEKKLLPNPTAIDVEPLKPSIPVPSSQVIPQDSMSAPAAAPSTAPATEFTDILQVAKVNLRQFVERWNSQTNSPFQLNSDSPRRTISLLISAPTAQLEASPGSQSEDSPTPLTGISPSSPTSIATSSVFTNPPTTVLKSDIPTESTEKEYKSNHPSVTESNGNVDRTTAQSAAATSSTNVETAIEQTSALLKSVKDSLIRQIESGTAVRDRTGARVWDRKGGSPVPTTFVQRRAPQVSSVFNYAVQKFEAKQAKQPLTFRESQQSKPLTPHHRPKKPNEPAGSTEDWEVHPPVAARSFGFAKRHKTVNTVTVVTATASMHTTTNSYAMKNSPNTVYKMDSHQP